MGKKNYGTLTLPMSKDAYLSAENAKEKLRMWRETLSEDSNKWKTLEIKHSALLVIDMQKYFLDPRSHAFVPTGPAITGNIRALLQLYRELRRPISFTTFAVKPGEDDPIDRWWGDTVREGTRESEIVRELQPLLGEMVVRKSTYSPFHKTNLETFLQKQNIRQLLITGVLTNLCCETAAREAFVRDFDVFVVMDATAAYNEDMHLKSLHNLSYGFATPLSTHDVRLCDRRRGTRRAHCCDTAQAVRT
jgi:isochorismate hydrolase